MGFPKIRGTLFGGLNNKDYSILGSILGSPYFGKLPCSFGYPWPATAYVGIIRSSGFQMGYWSPDGQ